MTYLFIAIGLLLGGLSGHFLGALLGGVLGYGVAQMRKSAKATPPAGPPSADHLATVHQLASRVQTLERQVDALQHTVNRLSEAHPAPVPAPITVAVQPPAEAAPSMPAAVVPAERITLAEPPPAEPMLPAETPALDQPEEAPAPILEPVVLAAPVKRLPMPQHAQAPRSFKDHIPERLRPLIFGGNTIVKVGVLILFLGLSFLLKYVTEQVTVPLEMRYAGVALLGFGLLGLGWRLRQKRDASGTGGYGLILQGAGIGVMYLTTLAAMKVHPLLPATMGFAIMVLITAFSALLAVAQNAPWLAMVASTAGFATPVLVSTGHANHIALFSYLAILDMGIVAMAWFRAWRPLNLIGFIGTFTLAGGWASAHYTPEAYASTQGFLLLFFLMFTAIGVLFARRALALGDDVDPQESIAARASQTLKQLGRVDSTLVFGVPLAVYGLQYQMVHNDPWLPALSALVLGFFYVLLGGALWRGKEARYALLAEAYVVVGVLFGTLSVPLALEGVWTGATWAVEAAGMYWLGTRQHRTYTRAFALALLGGAAVRTLSTVGWSDAPQAPFLTGSVLGMAMLALSALSIGLSQRRARAPHGGIVHPDWERNAVSGSWWLAVAGMALMPWMLCLPLPASVIVAGMALATLWLGDQASLPELKACSPVLHIVAVAGFASTLHQHESEAMLSNGWQGLMGAVLIGLSMLGSAWLGLRETWHRAASAKADASTAPPWPMGSSLGIIAGLALISGSLLFMMPAGHAALVWPVLGLALLWLGLKLAHPALSLSWAGLTAASAIVFTCFGPPVWPLLGMDPTPLPWHGPTGGLAWWTPLVLTLCSVTAAIWLHAAARRISGWRMPWVSNGAVHLVMLCTSLWWWAQTVPPEILRYLYARDLTLWTSACLSLWVTLTSALMLMLASRQNWPLMGQAAGLTIPMWLATLLIGPITAGRAPLADLGWVAWPTALLWHGMALRQSARWWSRELQGWMHVAGFWLFSALAFRQVQWSTDQWTTAGTAWQALGWLVVPIVLTAWVSLPGPQRRWPLRDFTKAYRFTAALPWVAALLGWLAWSAVNAGEASPLPYVPVLNPLELGQGLTVLTLWLWARALSGIGDIALPGRDPLFGTFGGIGFVMLTTMVLRACHHWAGVPWHADDLFDSRLTQAALSVTWALLGVGLMILGHRRVRRVVWALGAALLGVVVAKLFFVELADHGSLYRIISFIVVGLLLLAVGYFAPVPPSDETTQPAPLEDATT